MPAQNAKCRRTELVGVLEPSPHTPGCCIIRGERFRVDDIGREIERKPASYELNCIMDLDLEDIEEEQWILGRVRLDDAGYYFSAVHDKQGDALLCSPLSSIAARGARVRVVFQW